MPRKTCGKSTLSPLQLSRYYCAGLGLLLVSVRLVTGQIVVNDYLIDDGHGNCTVWGGSDSIEAGLTPSVSSDAVPGDYNYDLAVNPDIIGGGGNIVRMCCGYGHSTTIHVNSDGSWTADPDLGLAVLNNAGGRGASKIWVVCNSAPARSVHSEGSLDVTIQTVPCPPYSPQTVHTAIPIQIGTATQVPTFDKPNDPKLGGNQRSDCGMAEYSAHAMLASLNIQDNPIRYAPPFGRAVNFTVTYNQRENQQPQTFSYSNLGPKWTLNWLSYVKDDPNNASANALIYVPGGGTELYSGFDSSSQDYLPDPQSHAVLHRTSSYSYEKRFPDGSRQIYVKSDGSTSYPRRIFMTQWLDAVGNDVVIGYDSSFRITTITDALGQVTTLSYDLPGDPLKITKVTEPFATGRFASFSYTNGQLTTITDEIGIQSQFHYTTGTDFIDSMTTPYGTSHFSTAQNGTNRWIEMTDPLGGKERVEYRDNAPGINPTDPVGSVAAGFNNAALDVANTFYWTKKAIEMYPPVNGAYDYTKAKITHWAKNANESVSGIVASEKAPLENRVWRAYAGQSDTNHAGPNGNASQIARVLDDGTTQLSQYEYNGLGKLTKSTDPLLRVTSYVYAANNIDLLTVYQRTPNGSSTDPSGAKADQFAAYSYDPSDPPHLPRTYISTQLSQTTYSYNTHGQVLTVTAPNRDDTFSLVYETTTYAYSNGTTPNVPTGYLASITSPPFNGTSGPVSAVTSFTYDAANRVRTVTEQADGYTVTTDYDALDRPTIVTYPDGTHRNFDYTDPVRGMTLDLTHSSDRRGRLTTRHYDANRHMDSITEPVDNQSTRTTSYNRCTCGALDSISDANGHTTSFNRDLQSRVTSKTFADNTSISYAYENTTSRLKSITDALNQVTNYQYFSDDNLKQVSYANAIQPTPTVSFTYDPNYSRVTRMTTDGVDTTDYDYYYPGFGSPPHLWSATSSYSGVQVISGWDLQDRPSGYDTGRGDEGILYDSLGRPGYTNTVVGPFHPQYDLDVTPRLKKVIYETVGSRQALNQTTNYTYLDNLHDMRLHTLQDLTSGSANVSRFDYTYDAEGQISTWTKQLTTSPATTSNLTYDLADRLTNVTNTTPGNPSTSFNYVYDLADNRTSDSATTYSFNDPVNEITNTSYKYDANGNVTSDGVRSFEWDAANRLTAIVHPGDDGRTEFTYDGLGHRIQLVEKDINGTVQRTSHFIWHGMRLIEERDGANNILKQFAPNGVAIWVNNLGNSFRYYSKDHLGSVRGITDTNGTILATLDYDAYGGISRAPVPANDTSGGGPVLIKAVSRLTHGSAGTFDVNLPLSGAPGIEMRNQGSGSYTLVLTFDRPISGANAVAKVVSGVGTVNGSPGIDTSDPLHSLDVQLTGVANGQTITVEVDNVIGVQIGSTQTTTPKVFVGMSVLVGDVNQNGAVTVEDLNLIKGHFGATVNSTNFMYDTDANGLINNSDMGQTKANASASLFPDFAFAGYYYHARSGLYLTPYRGYSPTIGRWLSRDPLENAEMSQGPNLYSYVANKPARLVDPLGLEEDLPPDSGTTGTLGTARGTYAADQGFTAIAQNSRQYPIIYGGSLLGPISKWFGDLFDGLFGASVCEIATTSTIADTLAPGGDLLGTAGTRESIRMVTGDITDAQTLFTQLTQGGTVVNNSYPGVWVQLADGSELGLRTVATRSPGVVATIDVQVTGVAITKIKFKP